MAKKTIDHMNLYVAIAEYQHENAPDQTFNCLRVYVSYRKGRGFIVGYHPGWGDERWWGCMLDIGDRNPLTGGQEVLAKAATKNSVKELQAMYDSLNQGTARKIIALLFDHRKWPILLESLRHIALSSTWATEELLASLTRQLTNNENLDNKDNNSKQEETMAKEMKAADLIGKTITVVNNDKIKYVIKSIEGDKLITEFCIEGKQPMSCPVPMSQLEKMMEAGTWKIEATTETTHTTSATASDDVEEVDDIKVEPAKTVKMEQEPKKKTDKPKQEKSNAKGEAPKADARLRYETYTNKKGKTCAKIIGFGENDPAYVNAADLHGSATYERDKDGGKTFYLIFGPRYATAANEVCKALNEGKPLDDCQAIIDKATEERARQRDEWKQKREERKAAADAPKGKTYTEAEVADLLKRVIAGDKEAMEIVNAMSKAA